jgi:MFS family permease
LIARWDERRTATVGLVLLGLGIAPTMGTSLALIVVGLLGCGIGVSLTVVSFVTLRQRRTPPTLQGRAAAASNMAFNVPQLSAALAATGLILVVDYRVLIGVTVAVILVAAAGIGLLRTRRPEDEAAPAAAGTVGG